MNGADKKLPCGWSVVPLKEIADTSSGGTPFRKESAYYGGDIAWVKSGELGDGIVTKVEESITEAGLQASSAKIFPKGTLCIALYGATVGKLGILGSEAATNQAVCGIFLHPDIATEFAFHFLKHQRADLIAQGKGGAQPNISQEIVRDTEIILAPAAEQRRIVAKIEALQERSRKARAALEAIPPLLEQFRQSVLAAAFRGDLTADWRAQHPDVEPASVLLDRIRAERRRRWEEAELTDSKAKRKPYGKENGQGENGLSVSGQEERLSPIPLMWEWASVGQVSYIDGGLTRNKSKRERGSTTAPLVTVAAVKLRAINPAEIGEITLLREDGDKGVLKTGDLLIVEGNGSLAHIGRVALWDGSVPEARHQNHLIRIRPLLLDPRFLLEWLASPLGREFIIAEATSAAGLYNLSISKIGRIHIPLPSLAEQIQILQCIKDRLSNLDDLEQEVVSAIERLDQLDQSILAKAFRGELVPQDPNDEPASVLLERIRTEREAQSAKPRAKKKTLGSTKRTKKAPPVSVNENDDLPLFNSLQK